MSVPSLFIFYFLFFFQKAAGFPLCSLPCKSSSGVYDCTRARSSGVYECVCVCVCVCMWCVCCMCVLRVCVCVCVCVCCVCGMCVLRVCVWRVCVCVCVCDLTQVVVGILLSGDEQA